MTVTLADSNLHCHEVTRTRARNFYYGMKLTPEPKRTAMYAVYAWMRLADDLADEAGDDDAKAARLDQFRTETFAVLDGREPPLDPVWPAIKRTVEHFEIPRQYLHDMIDGQLMDMAKRRYRTFEELYDYCYKVASVVGLTCIQIWGFDGKDETRQLAEWRGIAFQLTNILRDVLEDAQRDRVYLPAEDYGIFEVNPTMFELAKSNDALVGIHKNIERAADYYRKSQPLDELIDSDGRACLWAMTKIYHGLFKKIQRQPSVVLSGRRVRLASVHKAWIAMRAKWMKDSN
jgi:phytoene synthase